MPTEQLQIEYRPLSKLIPYARNARTHSDTQVAMIASSIKEFGWTNPVLVDGENGIIAGHGRILAARLLAIDTVPVIELAHLTEVQRRAYVLADNKLAEAAGWDEDLLRLELGGLKDLDFDLDIIGFDPDELNAIFAQESGAQNDAAQEAVESLAERFLIAPFSVLDARRGWWRERKESWLALGLRSDVGRGESLAFSKTAQPPEVYAAKNRHEQAVGRKVSWDEFLSDNPDVSIQTGTSIFDPVLCELAYRWFCPPSGIVLDPFAGGSVRGVVAGRLGRHYYGCDLRQEQVQANREQWECLSVPDSPAPTWHCGDSQQIDSHFGDLAADLVFSCPPYADLEVYSDDPRDLSTMSYDDFLKAYRQIITRAVSMLRTDRFAVFVVGEVRAKDGVYLNFVGDTIRAFEAAGARYYNEAILVTQAGSLAIRVGKQFSTSRKIGKTHQNVLVFLKGDAKRAALACGLVEVDDLFDAEPLE